MGIYIDPVQSATSFDKLNLIAAKAERVLKEEFRSHNPGKDGVFGVAVIDNGFFNAAAVAYNTGESKAFCDTSGRPCQYFKIHIDSVRELDPRTADNLTKYVK